MKAAQDISCCVVDCGIFIHVARRLAAEYARVYYFNPTWETEMPRINRMVVGDGYPEIKWVESLWEVFDECDLFVFPDVGFSGLQHHLLKQGKAVWGCRNADGLEARRGLFLKVLSETNLPVPPHNAVKGITNLRLFLRDNPDKYIKVSTYRGNFETCHFRSMEEDETMIDAWAVTLGPLREHVIFYVFDPIESEIEDGCDAWCVDGQWPQTVIHGVECKDKSYLGTFQKFEKLPDEVRVVNDEFGPVLARYGYRNFFSTEVRITKEKESYFIDPTCRSGSPPSQIMCDMIGNLGEIVWRGANGDMVEPEQNSKFGVQAIFHVDRDEWAVLDVPEEIQPWVKVSFSCMVDGRICVPPDPTGYCEIGWVTGIGDTIGDAIDSLREHVEGMPEGVHVEFRSLADLLKEVKTAGEQGMKFTDGDVPEPESVMADD